jgi:hypothetical protein
MTRRRKSGVVKCALLKDRGISGRCEQQVPVADRDTEPLGQMQNHLPAGLRPAGFDKAQMPLGDFGFDSEAQLAESAPVTPFPQQRTE